MCVGLQQMFQELSDFNRNASTNFSKLSPNKISQQYVKWFSSCHMDNRHTLYDMWKPAVMDVNFTVLDESHIQ